MINPDNIDAVLNQYSVPEGLHPGLKRYLLERVEPGSFLLACLCNDLMAAVTNADEFNIYRLRDIMRFMYNELPMREYADSPWGSPAKVKAWLESEEAPRW